MRNYSTCCQIVSGISDVSVSRLKQYQELMQTDKYTALMEQLNNTLSPQDNFKAYRMLNHEPPCLPVLGASNRRTALLDRDRPCMRVVALLLSSADLFVARCLWR